MERWHSLTLLEMREMPEEEAQRMEQQHSVFLREMERQWNLKQALLRVVLDLQAVLPLLRDEGRELRESFEDSDSPAS